MSRGLSASGCGDAGWGDVLQLQAACGFRAFAEMRLRATEMEDVELGMDARERGNVVHKVLEAFWELVKTQSALKAMRGGEREEKLSWAVGEGLKRTAELSETAWDEEYVEMQRERIQDLAAAVAGAGDGAACV